VLLALFDNFAGSHFCSFCKKIEVVPIAVLGYEELEAGDFHQTRNRKGAPASSLVESQ